ncbi:MAG TPA: hypothetical protein VHN99_11495 [Deinococcales bacterium]|nr:hypothetical protein [Deinococcales bacterium]
MANLAATVSGLTALVQNTLARGVAQAGDGVRVTEATVTLKAVFDAAAGGGADLSALVPLKLGAKVEGKAVHTLEFTLTTELPALKGLVLTPEQVSYELGRALDAVRIAARQAAQGPSGLGFKEGKVSLEWGVTEDGEITVLGALTFGGSREAANTLTLALGPA